MATYTIAAAADDGHESSNGTTDTSYQFYLIANDGYHTGFRFQNVAIPAGSTITAATISVHPHNAANLVGNAAIYAEDTDDAAAFTAGTANYNISSRTKTTATVNWSATLPEDVFSDSPDISSVIQEVIDRPGWSSGNALAIIWQNGSGSTLRFRGYEFGSSTRPYLTVTWTEGGGGKPHLYYAMMAAN